MHTIKAEDLMTLQNNERVFILRATLKEATIQALTNVGWTDPVTGGHIIVEEGNTVRVRMVP